MTAPQIPLTDDQSRNLLIGLEHGASTTAHLIWQGAPVPQSQFDCSRAGHELMRAAADDPLVRESIMNNIRQMVAATASAITSEG